MGKTTELQRLTEEWYAKLKASGFDDIEATGGHIMKGTFNHTRLNPERVSMISNHYRLASHFLHDHKWDDETQRHIWKLYCEGVVCRKIAQTIGIHYVKVHRLIKAIARGPFKSYRENQNDKCEILNITSDQPTAKICLSSIRLGSRASEESGTTNTWMTKLTLVISKSESI